MNKKELHALVYETKTGELRLVVVDDIGNIRFADSVSAEYLPHMLNHPHEVESWKMPADIEDARKWWNATAATPGTELVYCRRPSWENMRNAARRAFGAVSPTPPNCPQSMPGKRSLSWQVLSKTKMPAPVLLPPLSLILKWWNSVPSLARLLPSPSKTLTI